MLAALVVDSSDVAGFEAQVVVVRSGHDLLARLVRVDVTIVDGLLWERSGGVGG